ncbi:MAG: HK97 family phage prohead protease [Propionivibrio sp.]|nr:HK97 family phage prohead protease [Propionivibrio sp.]
MKYLNRPIEIKAVNEDGLFSGYASVFEEIDSYRDIVKRGAFEKTLAESESKGRAVPILWQHDAAKPIGVYTELKEDEHGLYVEGQLNMDVQQAREALSLLRQKALSGISIGYNSVRYDTDVKSGVRRLYELKLFEASLVTFPACDSARVTDVKTILADGNLPSLPEFEDFLCEAGFSRSQAKAIAGNGLTKLIRREVGSDEDEAIQRALAILKS